MWVVFRMISRLCSDQSVMNLAVVIRCSLFDIPGRGSKFREVAGWGSMKLSASLWASERAQGLQMAVSQAWTLFSTLGQWVKCWQGQSWDWSKGLHWGSALTPPSGNCKSVSHSSLVRGHFRLTVFTNMSLKTFLTAFFRARTILIATKKSLALLGATSERKFKFHNKYYFISVCLCVYTHIYNVY